MLDTFVALLGAVFFADGVWRLWNKDRYRVRALASRRRRGRKFLWRTGIVEFALLGWYAGFRAPRAGWLWVVVGAIFTFIFVSLTLGVRSLEGRDPMHFKRVYYGPIQPRGLREKFGTTLTWLVLLCLWSLSWW